MHIAHFVYPFITQVVSTFGLLWILLLWTWVYKYLFESPLSVLWGVYSGVELLDHIVNPHLTFWGTTSESWQGKGPGSNMCAPQWDMTLNHWASIREESPLDLCVWKVLLFHHEWHTGSSRTNVNPSMLHFTNPRLCTWQPMFFY